jgi:hypothetical protein
MTAPCTLAQPSDPGAWRRMRITSRRHGSKQPARRGLPKPPRPPGLAAFRPCQTYNPGARRGGGSEDRNNISIQAILGNATSVVAMHVDPQRSAAACGSVQTQITFASSSTQPDNHVFQGEVGPTRIATAREQGDDNTTGRPRWEALEHVLVTVRLVSVDLSPLSLLHGSGPSRLEHTSPTTSSVSSSQHLTERGSATSIFLENRSDRPGAVRSMRANHDEWGYIC